MTPEIRETFFTLAILAVTATQILTMVGLNLIRRSNGIGDNQQGLNLAGTVFGRIMLVTPEILLDWAMETEMGAWISSMLDLED